MVEIWRTKLQEYIDAIEEEEDMGITEGDYNKWTWQWSWPPPNGLIWYGSRGCTILTDDVNDLFYLWWYDSDHDYRFGAYNIADHSTIFESPAGSEYMNDGPCPDCGAESFQLGYGEMEYAGIRQSIQTYILLAPFNVGSSYPTNIEVWRAGIKLWTYNLKDLYPGMQWVPHGSISLTGKYIIIMTHVTEQGTGDKIDLFKGSKS